MGRTAGWAAPVTLAIVAAVALLGAPAAQATNGGSHGFLPEQKDWCLGVGAPELTAVGYLHAFVRIEYWDDCLFPAKSSIEIRSGDMDKGIAVQRLVEEYDAQGVLFVGDDLGDVPAFEAVAKLRDQGLPTMLVCSGSDEESTLRDLADLVVAGPDGVMAFLRRLTGDLAAAGAGTGGRPRA